MNNLLCYQVFYKGYQQRLEEEDWGSALWGHSGGLTRAGPHKGLEDWFSCTQWVKRVFSSFPTIYTACWNLPMSVCPTPVRNLFMFIRRLSFVISYEAVLSFKQKKCALYFLYPTFFHKDLRRLVRTNAF
jgi:hypothetical protein